MSDREPLLPLLISFALAALVHAGAGAGYVWYTADPPAAAETEPAEARPDLQIDRIVAPEPAFTGRLLAIDITTVNAGDAPAAPHRLTLTLGDGRTLAGVDVPAVGPGASFSHTAKLTFDSPGVRKLIATVDPGGVVDESSEANNRRHTWLTVIDPPAGQADAPALPDAVVLEVRTEDLLIAGRQTQVFVHLANAGGTALRDLPLAMAVDGQVVKQVTLEPVIAPGMSFRGKLWLNIDQPGEHSVCIIADPDDAITEIDETNNRRCFTAAWLAADPRSLPGEPDPTEVTINWLSYDDFEALMADRERRQAQPMVQDQAEPLPEIQATPPKPTDPGLPRPAVAGAPPSAGDPPTRPIRAIAPAGEADGTVDPTPAAAEAESPSYQRDQEPAVAPPMPEAPAPLATSIMPGDLTEPARVEPVAAEGDQPRQVIDTTPNRVNPADNPAAPGDPADVVDLTDPLRSLDAEGADPLTPEAVGLPRLTEKPIRETPDVPPMPGADPDNAGAAVDIDAPTEDRLTTSPAPMDAQASPGSPQFDPVDVAAEDALTNQPDAPVREAEPAEDPARGDQQDQTRQPQQQTKPTTTATARPARPGHNARPTAAPRTESESPPVTQIDYARVKPGQVIARRGVTVLTDVPDPTIVTRRTLASAVRNPVFNLQFNQDGEVVSLTQTTSSGNIGLDAALQASLYQWEARGEIAPEGLGMDELTIIVFD